MNARTSRSATAGPGSTDINGERTLREPDLAFDDLLDARFDEQGRLSQLGRGSRQRIAERLDARPPVASAEQLERAVRQLAEGLEAIERHSRTRQPDVRVARSDPGDRPATTGAVTEAGRDFVTYSLDRLEARLEALSQRLQSRAATAGGADIAGDAAEEHASSRRDDPSLAVEPDFDSESAELLRMAEAEAERVQREAEAADEERRRAVAVAEAERRETEARHRAEEEEAAEAARRVAAAAAEAARRETEARLRAEQAEAAEAIRRAEEEAAEARREAETATEERRRQAAAAEAARIEAEAHRRVVEEAHRRAEEEAAEARRHAEEEAAEARLRAEEAEAEARRHAEAAEKERLARLADARRQVEAAVAMQRQFAEIEARIDALQRSADENQIAPVREELIELLHEIEDLSRGRHDVAAALEHIGGRLSEMEVKVNAARNMAGNRLGDIQDQLSGLTGRLDEIEVEIPGFDAIRENQGAVLERFDRMEGLVHRLASPEELLDRVDGLRRQLGTVASQQASARIEEHILNLAERLDALPEDLSDADALERIEDQLATLASELTAARQQRMAAAADLDRRLSDLSTTLQEVGESGRTPDLSGLEGRLAEFGDRFERHLRLNNEAFSKLERRLAALGAAIEEQEGDAAAEILAGLTRKIDALAEAIEAQDTRGARNDIEVLDGKLDQVAQQLAEQAEHLSRSQVQPLAARLDDMQHQLEELAQRAQASSDQFRPFAKQLQEISERLSTLGSDDTDSPLLQRLEAIEERLAGLSGGRGPDPRALQTQLEGIVSRLELLKGRSIDPARLNDLFDRVDAAIRALPDDRIEQLERLERRIAESAKAMAVAQGTSEVAEQRFGRLERKLEELGLIYSAGGEFLSAEDIAELRSDIVALRRELRSLPGLSGEDANLSEVLQGIAARMERLPDAPPATAAELEAQMERIAALLDDPSQSRLALAHIETSLRTIEERLEETRRSLAYRPARHGEESAGDVEVVAGMARALSDDVNVLRGSTAASEKKTKDALDAVQETLEAVVKRMAFLERDADAAEAADYRPHETAEPRRDAAAELVKRFEPTGPAGPHEAEDAKEPEAAAAAEPGPSEPRASGGLLARFTSRQLLKRATGGRAESFLPEPEESEDGSDFPLEPGTDSPLSSALSGAPSSDTQFMSGARSRSRLVPPLAAADERPAASDTIKLDAAIDEDFLAAARRAARAAAAEASDESDAAPSRGLGRLASAMKSRRGALLAAALAVAVAFAAVQIIRSQTQPVAGDIAVAPTGPVEPAADARPAAAPAVPVAEPAVPETMQAEAPAADTPLPSGADAKPAESAAVEAAEPTGAGQVGAGPDVASAPAAGATPAAPATEDMAALAPTPGEAPEPPAAAAEPQPAQPELPESIGSQRLRDAAAADDPAAAFEVAARYAEGRGVSQDMRTAVVWYERAAATGLAPAQYRLGSIYEKGLGVPRDLVKAQAWYSTAAEAGNVKAMHNLAVLFAEGAGGEPDLERAAELFRRAAERGVRDSQFNLAILHARGLGVPQDLIEAYKWFSVAATSGDEEAAKRRDIIAAALPEGDLGKAQAAAAAFEPLPLVSGANEVIMPEGGWSDTQDSTSVEAQPPADDEQVGSALSENDLVALVQKLLADKGFDPGPADGLLGRQTMQAILDFQGEAGLPKTGQINPELVDALKGASG